MARPIKPAPDPWWWPRLTPGFVVLCVLLGLLLVVVQLLSIDAGLYLMMAAVWGPILMSFRHRAGVAKRVLSRQGVTCPCCLRELTDDAPCCPRCDAGLSRSVYVDYWTMVSEKPAEAELWWRSMREAERGRGRSTYLSSASRWQVGLFTGMLLLTFTVVVVLRPAAVLALDTLWLLPIYTGVAGGIWLARTRGRRRAGTSTHCVGCDYQVDPTRLDMPECPECGRRLSRPGQTVTGRRVGHGGYTLLGYMIALASVLTVFLPLVGGSFFDALSPSSYLPVSLYVDDALGGDPDYKTWRVLESRYAKPEDVQRLADAVLAQIAGEVEPDDNLRSYRMDVALAFQLDGPDVPEDLRFEVALALMQDQDRSRLFELRDWLEQYLTTVLPGSNAYRVLMSAAESSFASGQADYRVTRWLGDQRGEPLALYNEFGQFCQSLLTLDTVTNTDGQSLVIRTNPSVTLSPGLHPDEPVALYLRIVEPGSSTDEIAPSDLRFDPFEHLGRSHTLATIPIDDGALNPDDYRVLYVVYVGEAVMPASIVQWYNDWPMLPGNVVPVHTFGPMELTPGRMLARDLSLHPRSRPLPHLPSRPR